MSTLCGSSPHDQNHLLLAQADSADPRYKEIPPQYTSLVPLDASAKPRGTTGSLGYVTTVYKVIGVDDGIAYALRRADNVRSSSHVTSKIVHAWGQVLHPNIVTLKDAFVYQNGKA